ncbi:MAG: acyl-protein synthase, partial [Cyanobacteria bacterium REEB65]|nr:acyl-protein synthase [Cyanobacteria bacterium REEB65]
MGYFFDMSGNSAVDRLLALEDVYEASGRAEMLFGAAMREAVNWHYEQSDVYRGLCQLAGFDPANWRDLAEIPTVFVNAFKQHELLSIPRDQVALTLTSSGTSGQRSQICFDRLSLDRALGMVERIFAALGMVDKSEAVNYLLFAYDPNEAKNVGTAFTDSNLTHLTAQRAVYHALRWDAAKGDFVFRVDR